MEQRNLESYTPCFLDNLHMVNICKGILQALERIWGPYSETTRKTRAVLNQLVGRDDSKASLWSDRGSSLRDWRKLFALIATEHSTNPALSGLPLAKDEKAIEIITLMSEIFQITYSQDAIGFEERCLRTLSLLTRGFLVGKLCME